MMQKKWWVRVIAIVLLCLWWQQHLQFCLMFFILNSEITRRICRGVLFYM